MALALARSAFGPGSTLYSVLGCAPSSTPDELKRAYRRAALRHHPDRDRDASSTLKFQAVSAAYQVLMDGGRRAAYDATGDVAEDEAFPTREESDGDDGGSKFARGGRETRQTHFERFFRSVFDEIISTGSRHYADAKSYRGSEAEREDVLHYYTMCKGDWRKVVECIVHGSPDEVIRWKADIVDPALAKGEIQTYSDVNVPGDRKSSFNSYGGRPFKQTKRRILEDSSSDEEITASSSKKRLGKTRRIKQNSLLVDTDDESEDDTTRTKSFASNTSATSTSMSKRDKLDYRVAKKRKAKAEKEMEVADMIRSKNWGKNAAEHFHRRTQKKAGVITDALLANMEERYGKKSTRKKKR
ncbi:hypothetical protein ACHAWF_002109 [Thalassiosira exigua]